MNLVLGLVTRGRPELLRETVNETVKNIRDKGTHIAILADEDDSTMEGFRLEWGQVSLDVRPREDYIGEKWNRMLRIPSRLYADMVDHSPIRTPGFDLRITEASKVFPDGIGAVCDRMCSIAFPHMHAVTEKMVELMGGFFPGHFPYWFVDHWLDDICKMTGRISYADVEVDSSKRPGTMEQREPALWASLYDALYGEREEISDRIIKALDDPQWRKDMLRKNYPLTHQRSRYINSIVRGVQGTCTATDKRYERIRAEGIAKIQKVYGELKEAA